MDEQPNSGEEENASNINNIQAPASSILGSVKREAIQELVPLIESLDVSPERRFEIIMSAVRVDFSEELLKKALEAAKGISDPAEKATALIDVINETNFQAE